MNSDVTLDTEALQFAIDYLAPWPDTVIGVIPVIFPVGAPAEYSRYGVFLCIDTNELPADPPAVLLRAAVDLATLVGQANLAGRPGTYGWFKIQRNGSYTVHRTVSTTAATGD